jgi:hypothetical protein
VRAVRAIVQTQAIAIPLKNGQNGKNIDIECANVRNGMVGGTAKKYPPTHQGSEKGNWEK